MKRTIVNTDFDVMVIGAGMAGITAAQHMKNTGKTVCVIDKARSVGGRMSTRKLGSLQWDHGAQYFTAQSPEFRTQVALWLKANLIAQWEAPIGAWDGATLTQSSPKERFVGTPTMKSPLAFTAKNLHIELNTIVTEINSFQSGWHIESETKRWSVQQLIVALPAPQAQALLPKDHASYSLAANALMEPCWALILSTKVILPLPFSGIFINQGAFSWIAQDGSKPARNSPHTWVLHATTEWSAAHLDFSSDEITALLMADFNALLKNWLPDIPTPQFENAVAHRWRFARGHSAQHNLVHVWPQDGLALAGDWIAGGRVEGAYLSGIAAARKLIDG